MNVEDCMLNVEWMRNRREQKRWLSDWWTIIEGSMPGEMLWDDAKIACFEY